jgi:hypothetical protein
MSDKQKKFEPSMGWIVAINHQQVAVARLAQELQADPIELGKALERAGYRLEPDPYDLSADTWKVLDVEKRKLEVVK